MKRFYVAMVAAIIVILAVGAFLWVNYLGTSNALKHETDRWAVIQDVNGDIMAVETSWNEVWSQLVQMQQNGSRLWVGSIVERYDSKWGFRFMPENLTVAQVTIEEAQATIRYISENLELRLGRWTYVSAKVMETHSP